MAQQEEELANQTAANGVDPTARFLEMYTVSAAIVWAGLFIAVAVVLKGSGFFAQLLPILTGAMVWFVIIIPSAATRSRRRHGGTAGQAPAR
jgi:hypothetical protein